MSSAVSALVAGELVQSPCTRMRRRRADGQVQVGAAGLDQADEQGVELVVGHTSSEVTLGACRRRGASSVGSVALGGRPSARGSGGVVHEKPLTWRRKSAPAEPGRSGFEAEPYTDLTCEIQSLLNPDF